MCLRSFFNFNIVNMYAVEIQDITIWIFYVLLNGLKV